MNILKKLVIWGAALSVCGLVYKWVAKITLERSLGFFLQTPIDNWIPFVPATVFIYLSLYIFWLPIILSPRFTVKDFLKIALVCVITLCLANLIHLIIPASCQRPEISNELANANLAAYILKSCYLIDLPNNAFPSEHVLMTLILLIATKKRFSRLGYILCCLWSIAIIISTLTVKQHQIADILAALPLAFLVKKIIFESSWFKI